MTVMISWLLLLLSVSLSSSLIGYDCFHPNANVTSVSLLSVQECPPVDSHRIKKTSTHIQVLQDKTHISVHVYQCKVNIIRLIQHCGMHSHVSAVSGGLLSHLYILHRYTCLKAHSSSTLDIYGTKIVDLRSNSSLTSSITLAGEIRSDASCKGASYADQTGSYSSVIVSASVEVTLKDFVATVNLESDQIVFPSGLSCPWKQGNCMDNTQGETFWTPLPTTACNPTTYQVLYEGPAEKIESTYQKATQTHISASTKDFLFSVELLSPTNLCHQKAWSTAHPRISVIFKEQYGYYFTSSSIHVQDISLISYINSKFVYLEHHFRQEISTMYSDILQRQCTIERKALENRLLLARQSPHVFGNLYHDKPGFFGVVAGEVIHLIECQPVEVTVRRSLHCYASLPVLYNNQTYFLLPKSHILSNYSAQTTCTDLTPITYFLDGEWISSTPDYRRTTTPNTLAPASADRPWEYSPLRRLSIAGLYDQESMIRLQEFLFQPMTEQAVTSIVARSVQGKDRDSQGVRMALLFSQAEVRELSDSIIAATWGWFSWFGTTVSGFLGIYFFVKMIKAVISFTINFFALQSTVGWSLWLLGSVFTSLTNWIIRRSETSKTPLEEIALHSSSEESPVNKDSPSSSAPPLASHFEETEDFHIYTQKVHNTPIIS